MCVCTWGTDDCCCISKIAVDTLTKLSLTCYTPPSIEGCGTCDYHKYEEYTNSVILAQAPSWRKPCSVYM